jgi:molybdenum cofactor biosynthesis enzyme
VAKKNAESTEQLDLMDVTPEYAKPLKAAARKYKKASAERQAALAEEVEAKGKVLEIVKAAGIKPDADGVTKCHVDGMTIKVTPRDELVRVKLDDDEEGDGADDAE